MQAAIKHGTWTLGALVVGFMGWAAFVPLDAGVPSHGMVSVEGQRKVVQHPRGGVIADVLIAEGNSVKQGDVLIKLENSIELANRSEIFSQLRVSQAKIAALEEILPSLRELSFDGFYPRNRVIELERQLKEAKSLERGYFDQLAAADRELARTEIRAPVAGRVMGVGVNTAGAVVIAGAKLMDIVPDNSRMTIQAQVRPHLIDKVKPGAQAQVRFSALESSRTPTMFGVIDWVSPDRFQNREDTLNPEGYYLANVVVSAQELEKTDGLQIIPGMPAEVMIKTGERTFFQYLLKPFSDRLAHAVKEP